MHVQLEQRAATFLELEMQSSIVAQAAGRGEAFETAVHGPHVMGCAELQCSDRWKPMQGRYTLHNVL